MSTRQKCSEPGCPDVVELSTNGAGRLIETPCPCCERRAAWARAHAPKRPPKPCTICGGPVLLRHDKGVNRKRCDACQLVHRRITSRVGHAQERDRRATVLPIRKQA